MNVRVNLFFFFAAAAKVNDTDVSFSRFAKQDVLGFQVAVYNSFILEEYQACQELSRESPDKRQREAGEIVCTDQFVEIDAEARCNNAQVRAEVE